MSKLISVNSNNSGNSNNSINTISLTNPYIQANSKWFFFTVLFIILDYTRIYQELHLGLLRPLMIVILVLVYFIFSSGEYPRAKSKQTTYMWLFIFLLACYIPFARNNHVAYITAKAQLLYMPFILSVIICIDSIERLKKFMIICICIEIYIAIYAFTHAGYGPGNYFEDENDLALYLNMWLPFCYFLFLAHKSLIKKIVCLTGLIIGILSIIVSFSRGGFLGLIAIGAVVWFFSTRKIITLFVIIILAGLMFLFAGEKYWAEISTSTNTEEGTGKERIESWKSGWRMFLDNPLGVGGNNFIVRFHEYQTNYFKRGMWGRAAHSLWFTLIPELGIFGIYIYFSLLYYNLKDIFMLMKINFDDADDEDKKYLNYLGRAFIASFTGYFVAGTFISVLYYAHYWYLTSIIIATIKISKKIRTDNLACVHLY